MGEEEVVAIKLRRLSRRRALLPSFPCSKASMAWVDWIALLEGLDGWTALQAVAAIVRYPLFVDLHHLANSIRLSSRPSHLPVRVSLAATMAPRKNQDISSYVEGTKVYLCDCPVYCLPREPAGKPKYVGPGTWFTHTAYRTEDTVADLYVVRHKSAQGRQRVVRKRRNLKNPPKGQPPQWPRDADEPFSVRTPRRISVIQTLTSCMYAPQDAREDSPMADAFPTSEAGPSDTDRDAPPRVYRATVEEVVCRACRVDTASYSTNSLSTAG